MFTLTPDAIGVTEALFGEEAPMHFAFITEGLTITEQDARWIEACRLKMVDSFGLEAENGPIEAVEAWKRYGSWAELTPEEAADLYTDSI